jgi:pilus assembly protein CpaB
MKAKLLLVLAVFMGLITTFLFFRYMEQYDSAAVMNEQTTSVLVAKRDITQNQLISQDMVELKQIPEKGIHNAAVSDTSVVVGKYATSNIVAGEQILSPNVKDSTDENLYVSRKLHEGYRAVSLGVNFVQTVSNLIEPEDYVDVILSEEDPDTKKIKSEIVVTKVRVLAVGRKMVQPVESVDGETHVEYSAVTLELNPDQAVKAVNADERGNIHLTLHTRVKPPEGGGANGK